jgi:glycosyltransferase involved in cell wall biosynthesis
VKEIIVNFICPQFFPAVTYGGPVFSTLHTSKELVKLGFKVLVSTTNANWKTKLKVDTDKYIQLEENLWVKYYNETIINRFSYSLAFNLWREIRKSDIVFIQYVFSISTPIGLIYAKVFRKPVLLSPRGSFAEWILSHGKSKKEWLSFLIKPFAGSIYWHATSLQEKKEILSVFPNAKVIIIPNGVKLEEYEGRSYLSRPEFILKYTGAICQPSHIIVSMGRIQKKKGFDILIKSFAIIVNEYPDAILCIAGEDEGELPALKTLAVELEVEQKVFFVGQIANKDKTDFFANADLFVLPSHNENFGNVYAESLASGTPIVASCHTPWDEVEKFCCGKWVNNTPEDTASAISELFKVDLQQYGDNGKEYIKKFTWPSIAREFERQIKEIVKSQ